MKESLVADSNALIALFDGDKTIARKLLSADRVYVPSVVCGEIDAGSSGPPAISHRNTRYVDRAGKYFLEYAA